MTRVRSSRQRRRWTWRWFAVLGFLFAFTVIGIAVLRPLFRSLVIASVCELSCRPASMAAFGWATWGSLPTLCVLLLTRPPTGRLARRVIQSGTAVAVILGLIFYPADSDWQYDQLLDGDRQMRAFAVGAFAALCAMLVTVGSVFVAMVVGERMTARRRRQRASARAVSTGDLAVALIGTAVLSELAALAIALSLA